ncbi:sulfite efflux pump Ssu1p [[Candida] jaroonii]|uniref:Sulfite efflux pump Ssu1p n=1 Tax=[Candida] jaroonii TaxID=467808 RepID=A0ACA9YE34_9ASCO|nr:sulfite efflux pump Ssu1p [[Candida] jaroonii]
MSHDMRFLQPDEETHVGSESDGTLNDSPKSEVAIKRGLFARAWDKFDQKLVKEFSPMFFVQVMATGISSAILHNFPFPSHWLRICSYIMWGLGIFYFLLGNVCLVLGCIKYKKFQEFHLNPKLAPFMGCYAMGYNSLVNELYFITGKSWIIGIFVLWWISVFLCIYTSFIIFFFTFLNKTKKSNHFPLDNFNATLLLPIVALTVTSSAGEIFAMDLPNQTLQLITIFVSYILWSIAIAMSFVVLTMIFHKYVVHKIPNTTIIFTTFIPIGFLGQGAFSVLQFGKNIHEWVNLNKDTIQALPIDIVNGLDNSLLIFSSLFGLFLFSFGYFNTFVAIASVLSKIITENPNPMHAAKYSGKRSVLNGLIRYNKGFWAMTFPLGTMSISNTLFGNLFDILTFKVIGAIYGVSTVVITLGCVVGSLYHLYNDLCSL